jgi:homoserine kinase type II
MAVKTRFSPQTIQQILALYDLGSFIQCQPISAGTVQTTYFILTAGSKFVFRYYENRSLPMVLFESELLQFLENHQYPCPMPLSDKQGHTVNSYRGKPYMMMTFLHGQPVEKPTDDHKAQLIQHAAWLQNLTEGYQPQHTPDRWNYDPRLCGDLARTAAHKISSPDARQKLTWFEAQLESLDLPNSLPKGICHCDFHFSNVLFLDDRFSGLIDFDDANYTYLGFDLIGMIDYWAWPFPAEQLRLPQAREISQTYEQYRSLSSAERHHLFDVHKLGILFDCIWNFGRGSGDDFYERKKIEHLDALGREAYEQALFCG